MTTEIPKDIINFGVRRQLDIQRYGNSVVRDIVALLNDAEKEVLAKIVKRGEDGTWTAKRLKELFAEIGDMTFEAYIQAGKAMSKEMKSFADHEVDATEALIASQVPVSFSTVRPSDAQLAAIVDKTPITVGPDKKLLLEEIFEGLAAGKEETIRGAVRLGVVEGETTDQIVRRLVGTRAARYTDGVLEKQRRGVSAMVRTIVNHTSNGAAQATYAQNSDLVRGWTFLATLDNRTTVTCRSLSGTQWPVGEGPLPPRHVNCLPGDSLVSSCSRVTAVSKRWYDGNLVVIKTASGRVFTSTPNHPVLSPGGWIAAGSLNVGGHVISYGGREWAGLADCDNQDVPARIEDVAEAFLNRRNVFAMPVPMSPVHFHGDGGGSKVAIIGADRGLWHRGDSPFKEHLGQGRFVSGHNAVGGFCPTNKMGLRLLYASCRIMCGLRQSLSVFWRCARHAGELLLAAVARRDPVFTEKLSEVGGGANPKLFSHTSDPNSGIKQCHSGLKIDAGRAVIGGNACSIQDSFDRGSANPKLTGNLLHGGATPVRGNHILRRGDFGKPLRWHALALKYFMHTRGRTPELVADTRSGLARFVKFGHILRAGYKPHSALLCDVPDVDSAGTQFPHDDISADAILARQISSGKAGNVFADEVVNIHIIEHHGHVYNLQTEENWYVAQGVVSHNCRSFATPKIKTFRELGVDIDEMPASTRVSKGGQVRADITMDEWMRTQTPAEIQDMLGASRAKLFLDGKLDIKAFTDDKGVAYTLSELKSRHAALFDRVFRAS